MPNLVDKKKVSSKEMADGLWMFCKKYSEGFQGELISTTEGVGIKLDEKRNKLLTLEIIRMNLWIISKALATDKSTLNELHKIYIFGLADLLAETDEEKAAFAKQAEKELTEIYKKYYDAWDDNSGGNQTILSGVILEQLLNEGNPDSKFLDMRLSFPVNLHVLGTLKSVLEFRNDFDVIEG